jgi:DNA-directed RNA polymerase subunit RPC12/RpoP
MSFKCEKCGEEVATEGSFGTANRNHCPKCLWSKHLDEKGSGDRAASCQGLMEPIGLTFKKEGIDKYGKERQGEIMLIHKCVKCGKVSINRLAGDDEAERVMEVFENSRNQELETVEKIKVLREEDQKEVTTQLFGKGFLHVGRNDK